MFKPEDHGYLPKSLFVYNGIVITLPLFGKCLNRSETYIEDCIFATSYEIARFMDNTFYGGNSVIVNRFARSYIKYKNMNEGEALYGKLIIGEREFPMKLQFCGNDLCVLCNVGFDVKTAEDKIRRRIEIPKYQC